MSFFFNQRIRDYLRDKPQDWLEGFILKKCYNGNTVQYKSEYAVILALPEKALLPNLREEIHDLSGYEDEPLSWVTSYKHSPVKNPNPRKKNMTTPKSKKKPTTKAVKAVAKTGAVEVVFSFDTTGSMYGCLAQVRQSVTSTVRSLFEQIPDLKVGVIAHGDYCDARDTYVTKHLHLTQNEAEICKFINTVGRTGGGDAPECYELVLREGRTVQPWTAGATKLLVVIGDNLPHEKSYHLNTQKIDWKNELNLLIEAGINVYGVHALGTGHSATFYKTIAETTGGHYIQLDQFGMVNDMILAVCYKQLGGDKLQSLEETIVSTGRMDRARDQMFNALNKRTTSKRFKAPKLTPVTPGRFQLFKVRSDDAIRPFVEKQGLDFKKGKGFYELNKPTEVQDYKEIIIVENSTGDMFTGDKVRDILKLPKSGMVNIGKREIERLTEDHKVFVQSTSVNRKLTAGSTFMYDVTDE